MIIADARTWIRDFARNAGDTSEYSDARIDRALQFVGARFVRKTRCTRTVSPVSLTASTSTFSTTIANFRPEYVLRAWIAATAEFQIVDHATLLQKQIDCPKTATPKPCDAIVAFTGTTTGTAAGEVYPTPPAASSLSLSLQWFEPFVDWTPGSGSPVFNIPDPWLKEILTYGVTAALQHNEVEHLYSSESWQKYLEFEQECIGAGNYGGRIIVRQPGRRA